MQAPEGYYTTQHAGPGAGHGGSVGGSQSVRDQQDRVSFGGLGPQTGSAGQAGTVAAGALGATVVKTEMACQLGHAGWQPDPTCEDPQEPSPSGRGGHGDGEGASEDESGTGAGLGALGARGSKRRREDGGGGGSASNGPGAGSALALSRLGSGSAAVGGMGPAGGGGAGAFGADDPIVPDDVVGPGGPGGAAAKRSRGLGLGGGGDLHTLQHLANIDVKEALRMFYNGKQQA